MADEPALARELLVQVARAQGLATTDQSLDALHPQIESLLRRLARLGPMLPIEQSPPPTPL